MRYILSILVLMIFLCETGQTMQHEYRLLSSTTDEVELRKKLNEFYVERELTPEFYSFDRVMEYLERVSIEGKWALNELRDFLKILLVPEELRAPVFNAFVAYHYQQQAEKKDQ